MRNDWCLEKSVFDKHIATPPKLGPVPQGAAANSDFPADAVRVWEHSITRGMAIFQKECEVAVFVGGKFVTAQISVTEGSLKLSKFWQSLENLSTYLVSLLLRSHKKRGGLWSCTHLTRVQFPPLSTSARGLLGGWWITLANITRGRLSQLPLNTPRLLQLSSAAAWATVPASVDGWTVQEEDD